jgi:phytoene desaturase
MSAAGPRHCPGRVVVVGAGLAGLSTAIRLAAAGVEVTVCEREARPGGRMGRVERDGFAFDTGPSVLTMPELVGDLYGLAGESMTDHLTLTRLDPAYRAVFHDGSELAVRASVEAMAAEIADRIGPGEARRFEGFAERLRALYEVELPHFIDTNYDSALDLAKPAAMARLIRLGGFRRVWSLVASHLSDWRLRRLFTFQSLYAGLSPFEALGLYAVIAYMDCVAGVYGVAGGMHAVSAGLAELAVRCGVDLRLATPVERVDVVGGRARGVVTAAGEHLPAAVVVCTPDLPVAYRDLLPAEATPRRVRRLCYSPSCVVVHLGLSRPLAGSAVHNVHFAADYRAGFDDLRAGRLQRDPSWLLSVPTRYEPAMAPPGGDVAFVLVPAPNLRGPTGAQLDWDAQAPREIEQAVARLERAGYGPVGEARVVAEAVTPADWQRQGMAAGTPFAASHRFAQTGPFRPANVAPRVDGVVFAGSGTVPGVGVPMVLLSGRLAAERVKQTLARRGPAEMA